MTGPELAAKFKRKKLAERPTWMLALIKVGPAMTAAVMAERLNDGRMSAWDRA